MSNSAWSIDHVLPMQEKLLHGTHGNKQGIRLRLDGIVLPTIVLHVCAGK